MSPKIERTLYEYLSSAGPGVSLHGGQQSYTRSLGRAGRVYHAVQDLSLDLSGRETPAVNSLHWDRIELRTIRFMLVLASLIILLFSLDINY